MSERTLKFVVDTRIGGYRVKEFPLFTEEGGTAFNQVNTWAKKLYPHTDLSEKPIIYMMTELPDNFGKVDSTEFQSVLKSLREATEPRPKKSWWRSFLLG